MDAAGALKRQNARMLIYGASGYTGELVAREAVRRGRAPILAGRNAATGENVPYGDFLVNATMIESLPHAGAVRVGGKIVPVPLAAETLELELPAGRRTVMSIPWGDVSTAFHTTGIPNVRVFSGVSPSRLRFLRRWRFLLPLAGLGPVKRALQRRVRRTVTGPDAAARRDGRVQIWGRARNAAGRSVTATFSTPEGYALTAITAVAVTSP